MEAVEAEESPVREEEDERSIVVALKERRQEEEDDRQEEDEFQGIDLDGSINSTRGGSRTPTRFKSKKN